VRLYSLYLYAHIYHGEADILQRTGDPVTFSDYVYITQAKVQSGILEVCINVKVVVCTRPLCILRKGDELMYS